MFSAAPLPHFDATREGFEAHRAWERVMHEGGWSVVSWPKEYGGRGLDLIEWLIFEEEYYPRQRPWPGQSERHLPAGADDDGIRHPGTENAFPAADGFRRGNLGPGLV